MLHVFYGNDSIKVRAKAHDFAEKKKKDNGEVVIIDADNHESGQLPDLAASASLFGGLNVYVIDTPSADEILASEVETALSLLVSSVHTFVIIEGPLLAAAKKRYEKGADTIEEYKRVADRSFNNFALADALLKKDKKALWLILNEARLENVPPEELVGVLWWQLKTLRLAASTRSASEAGLKDYPYNKAKRALGKFVPGEIERLSRQLIDLLHESRQGKGTLDLSLERFVLSV